MIDKSDKIIKQRRHGPDILVKLIHWTGVAAWLLMFIAIIIADKARPELPTLFDRIFNVQLRTTWDSDLLRYVFILAGIIFAICTIGLFLNTKRHHRKDDHYSKSLIIMKFMSGLGIILCLYYFRT